MQPNTKWKFAIGTTSRVPGSPSLHYLIADIDGPLINTPALRVYINYGKHILQATEHGWHLYTNITVHFPPLLKILEDIGADPTWIRIGKQRGYLYLADKKEIKFPWPVEHMVLYYAKKKKEA